MFPSPLLLDRYVVIEFSFRAHDNYSYPPEPEREGKVELADLLFEVTPHQHKDDASRWIFSLVIELPETAERKYPYSFKLELVGFFNIHPQYPVDKANVLANVNAPAVLYSAAREFLATVSGRGPYMAMWLPSVTFFNPTEPTAPKEGNAQPKQAAARRKMPAQKKRKPRRSPAPEGRTTTR